MILKANLYDTNSFVKQNMRAKWKEKLPITYMRTISYKIN